MSYSGTLISRVQGRLRTTEGDVATEKQATTLIRHAVDNLETLTTEMCENLAYAEKIIDIIDQSDLAVPKACGRRTWHPDDPPVDAHTAAQKAVANVVIARGYEGVTSPPDRDLVMETLHEYAGNLSLTVPTDYSVEQWSPFLTAIFRAEHNAEATAAFDRILPAGFDALRMPVDIGDWPGFGATASDQYLWDGLLTGYSLLATTESGDLPSTVYDDHPIYRKDDGSVTLTLTATGTRTIVTTIDDYRAAWVGYDADVAAGRASLPPVLYRKDAADVTARPSPATPTVEPAAAANGGTPPPANAVAAGGPHATPGEGAGATGGQSTPRTDDVVAALREMTLGFEKTIGSVTSDLEQSINAVTNRLVQLEAQNARRNLEASSGRAPPPADAAPPPPLFAPPLRHFTTGPPPLAPGYGGGGGLSAVPSANVLRTLVSSGRDANGKPTIAPLPGMVLMQQLLGVAVGARHEIIGGAAVHPTTRLGTLAQLLCGTFFLLGYGVDTQDIVEIKDNKTGDVKLGSRAYLTSYLKAIVEHPDDVYRRINTGEVEVDTRISLARGSLGMLLVHESSLLTALWDLEVLLARRVCDCYYATCKLYAGLPNHVALANEHFQFLADMIQEMTASLPTVAQQHAVMLHVLDDALSPDGPINPEARCFRVSRGPARAPWYTIFQRMSNHHTLGQAYGVEAALRGHATATLTAPPGALALGAGGGGFSAGTLTAATTGPASTANPRAWKQTAEHNAISRPVDTARIRSMVKGFLTPAGETHDGRSRAKPADVGDWSCLACGAKSTGPAPVGRPTSMAGLPGGHKMKVCQARHTWLDDHAFTGSASRTEGADMLCLQAGWHNREMIVACYNEGLYIDELAEYLPGGRFCFFN